MSKQATLELGNPDELPLYGKGDTTMGTATASHHTVTDWEDLGADHFDRLLTHLAGEHGIPMSIACQIPAPALARLCRDDQAQDLEDWRLR